MGHKREQIDSEAFYANKFYCDDESAVRKKALEEANEFLLKHDNYNAMSIVENWNESRRSLTLIVYYKYYI